MSGAQDDNLRGERRQGILLTVIGLAFVGMGALLMVGGDTLLGLMSVVLFGGCALVGFAQAVRPGAGLPAWVGIAGSICFAVTGLLLIVGHLAAAPLLEPGGGMALPAGILALGFFGPGAVVLIVRDVRRRRKR
ncbi:hypothetical protein [Microbacterium sp. Marseille-Q6965]|uniref:hypothetical protein n=1 Tax=Microbacterium sp. Marseille-Q6965 TaxID=2965072 RepID=UPI0021B7C3DE|nr:hypothetical protein [Microbacterium sp. Marseille-Q6965]